MKRSKLRLLDDIDSHFWIERSMNEPIVLVISKDAWAKVRVDMAIGGFVLNDDRPMLRDAPVMVIHKCDKPMFWTFVTAKQWEHHSRDWATDKEEADMVEMYKKYG